MVVTINSAPPIAHMDKDLTEARVAFITTAGIRLKSDPAFETKKGDPSFRLIPGDVDYADLTVNHDHYDTKDALEDINLVFPLDILRQFANEGRIGQVAPRHFGLMGYIPQVKKLMNKTAPAIADQLVADQVDIALLSPG
ncbi:MULTISPECIES: glycine/sarcosine/betaine reductase selenoprotein B family protein [Aerococcus]|uniref:Proline reductase n=1 Tax=Aerococcus sanguinicola TaxID=119206 RepID=A0A5N1GRH1_9LACT|nr:MULTISPECIES: glycine/sarcosine/betaine reductase selenoprotein B family protein [Aerococcus]KAA9301290.1 hypothetical protein F6I03_05320 [Aerococcus sanguinicola]MDK6370073.1 glycine/sarcosine/betaine reductase selenoprotein B family protein [Aerococcus sp. UMB9870]MDK6680661.1 glycine/sarcosine/betaine reductase selenoprotein B family protein [Aerococcus sp. UMB8608]MDK6687472.1 glycine/sarcosine/betaine reductase selenoprotein B family protein [Aerococcus sp. UMB8623]MDK6940611.1 glycin